MAGFCKYRTSRSVSPPQTPSYDICTWIRRSATSSQFHPSMENTMESTEGLSGVSHKTGYVSPLRARTMKEYEQQITELQKENFNLKLRLYFLEEKMDKSFDGDTRKLHEVNIQLKIEAENLRKDLEQKERLLKDSRINQQKIEEKLERECLEWKTQLEREHVLEQKLPNNNVSSEEKSVTEVSISEMCKEAFGLGCDSPYQTDVSECTQSDAVAKEKQIEEAVITLQRLDKLQQEELVDLREMAREKQSNLDSYVAKVKELQEQQQSMTDSSSSKLSKDCLDNGIVSDSSSSQSTTDIHSISRVMSSELEGTNLCTACENHAKKLLENHMTTMKKQSLKRDKIIQGLTEFVYKRDKEIERLKIALAEKESVELLMLAIVNTIEIAVNNPTTFDKVKDAVQELSSFLTKAQNKLKINHEKELPENIIKSLERHFLEWIVSIHCSSKNIVEGEKVLKERELLVKDYKKSTQSLLIIANQKNAFIQDLHCKLEKVKNLTVKIDNLVQLTGNVNNYKKHEEELEKTVKSLTCENSELKLTYAEMKRNFENSLNQKNLELNSVITVHQEAKENIRKLQQDLNDNKGQFIKCQKELSEVNEKYQNIQQQNSHSILNQEKQFHALNEKLENAYSALDKMKHAYKELEIKLQNVTLEKDQQIEIVNKGYKELQNEYVRIQSVLSEKNALCSKLKNELDNITHKFSVIQQEKILQNSEIDTMKLQLENCRMITLENKEREIQHLKDLVQEKTLMAESLIVELELKDSVAKQLQEELDTSCANRTLSDVGNMQFSKYMTDKNTIDIHNIKRHSLPINIYSAQKLGSSSLKCSKLMSQGLSNFGHSDNILELKEEICFLVLRIEKLEQQIREYDEGIGSKLSLLSGISEIYQDSPLNRTTKTWNILHAHIEELADFLECLLKFDSDGQLDISLLTPKNLARLKQYLLDSKELSQSLSATLLGNETAMMDGTLDIEPTRDVERIKEWLYTEKIIDEKTGKCQNTGQKGALENFHMNNLNNQDYGIMEQNWFQPISSDSDIWSEPDRTVSMQRMGVNISMQARMSHSPRKITSPKCDPNKNSPESAADKKVKQSKSTRPDINENLKNQVAECHAALQDKVVECNNLAQTKEVLEKELSECQDELVSCREMLEELKTQLEEKDRDYQTLLKAKQQLEEEEKANHRSHEEVHRKLVGLSELVESMQLKLSEEESKVLTISTERSHLVHQLENKVRENRQIQDWNLRLQKELEEKETICQQHQEARIKMKQLEENCAKLQVELTEYSILRKNLTNEVTMLKKEVNRKDKKLKEVMQLAQKLEESSIEKNNIYKKEQMENQKRISELEIEKNRLQQQLDENEKKLLETEKKIQTQINMNDKEELLNELKQLQIELAQNVNINRKLHHKLEKLQRQEYMEAVKDTGMHCNKDLSDRQDITSSLVEIKLNVPEIINGMHSMEKERDFDEMFLSPNYKMTQIPLESIYDKVVDPNYLTNSNQPFVLTENGKREEKTPSNFSSVKRDGDRSRQISGSTEDSRGQRSHYTSPDLGIESDPAHEIDITDIIKTNTDIIENENSKENFDILNVPSLTNMEPSQVKKVLEMPSLISLNKSQNFARQDVSSHCIEETLCAVCKLQDYELLKKEIEGSLISIKGIQARIKERLVTVASKTSPVKSLEYSTLKELGHSCSNIEFYLGKGWQLIRCFWTAPMYKKYVQPSNDEKDLAKENLLLSTELVSVKNQLAMQTKELQDAREKINSARSRKEKMERAISHQLVKTRQVLREAKGNLTESRKHKNGVEVANKPHPSTVKANSQISK